MVHLNYLLFPMVQKTNFVTWSGLFVWLVFLCSGAYAQGFVQRTHETNPNYREGDWISYSVAKYVTSIAIGDQYVYFGTRHAGITRYDFFRNRWDFPWTTSNGLADNAVFAVAYDPDTGFLWCATHLAISYYHPTAHRWRNLFKDEFGLPVFDEVESIGITTDKIVFVTRTGKVFEGNKFGGLLLVAGNNFAGATPHGKIRWFGKLAQKRRRFPQFFMSDGYLFDQQGIVEDPHFRRAEIDAYLEDRWGNLWIGTRGLGAGRADLNTFRLDMLNFGLTSPMVSALSFYDNELWMGSARSFGQDRGITAWNMDQERWRYYEQRDITDLESDQINAITVDGDSIWFATDHGLSLYDYKRGRWKTEDNFDGLSDNRVFDVIADKGWIYVATANGIDRISRKRPAKKDSLIIEHISPLNLTLVEVYDLELTKNLLWAGTRRGIFVYDTNKKEGGFNAEIGGPVNEVVTSISSYANEIWFGTQAGIEAYDLDKKEWFGVPEARSFPNTPINRILACKDAVWAATNHGVLKFNRKSRSWRTFNTTDGLLDDRVHALLLDGDYLWLGTNRGITQFLWNDPNRVD